VFLIPGAKKTVLNRPPATSRRAAVRQEIRDPELVRNFGNYYGAALKTVTLKATVLRKTGKPLYSTSDSKDSWTILVSEWKIGRGGSECSAFTVSKVDASREHEEFGPRQYQLARVLGLDGDKVLLEIGELSKINQSEESQLKWLLCGRGGLVGKNEMDKSAEANLSSRGIPLESRFAEENNPELARYLQSMGFSVKWAAVPALDGPEGQSVSAVSKPETVSAPARDKVPFDNTFWSYIREDNGAVGMIKFRADGVLQYFGGAAAPSGTWESVAEKRARSGIQIFTLNANGTLRQTSRERGRTWYRGTRPPPPSPALRGNLAGKWKHSLSNSTYVFYASGVFTEVLNGRPRTGTWKPLYGDVFVVKWAGGKQVFTLLADQKRLVADVAPKSGDDSYWNAVDSAP
jgi:hypothetical protein